MQHAVRLDDLDLPSLRIIHYPDPRLRQPCAPVEGVDDELRALVERIFELMFEAGGVGLAGPQVGVPLRLFIASPNFQGDDRRVYLNPRLTAMEGSQEDDEGCLSFPGITYKVKRYAQVTIRATGLDGKDFEETVRELAARIFQHEMDHLDGRLLVDRMGSLARLAHRRSLKELEDKYAALARAE